MRDAGMENKSEREFSMELQATEMNFAVGKCLEKYSASLFLRFFIRTFVCCCIHSNTIYWLNCEFLSRDVIKSGRFFHPYYESLQNRFFGCEMLSSTNHFFSSSFSHSHPSLDLQSYAYVHWRKFTFLKFHSYRYCVYNTYHQ